ncbi:MAG: succinate dehydrogenase/fumarate reductase iron-sulfur subunit [Blastocatellia bacterium]|jgi:succinate dehydrogenase / fumarate reductase iron-sulfur subunit|nr:succinate dehydrogenase/fumarate reductase iron-sulfur subunit [Blastocatellia bacterium]MBK6428690.1 succinate dehydrogenase/fumarate reductase iron-sulfur subunit [Blastocatellia bacterium]
MSESINVTLKVWRQSGPGEPGRFETYPLENVSTHASFLEMLDILNQKLTNTGKEPVAFDSDCREGICGSCGLMVDGQAHGPDTETATCQLHMRRFSDGDTITIEPWRARPFPVLKDLVVDRSAFDRIVEAGGYNSINAGNAPDANAILIPKDRAEAAMDAAACIGCGACVAACKNASAMLFVSAKVMHFARLPQGDPERTTRVSRMVAQMDEEGFGSCTNTTECEAACPKGISFSNIVELRREFVRAQVTGRTSR